MYFQIVLNSEDLLSEARDCYRLQGGEDDTTTVSTTTPATATAARRTAGFCIFSNSSGARDVARQLAV